MINPQFIEWIQEQIKKGWTIEQIRTYLLSINYVSADIDEAINSLNKPLLNNPTLNNSVQNIKPQSRPIKKIIVGFSVLFIIIGILFMSTAFNKSKSGFVDNNEEFNTGDKNSNDLKTSSISEEGDNIEDIDDTINEEIPEETIQVEEATTECNNNILEEGEICDSSVLNNETCITQEFSGGTLTCKVDCSGYDTSSCETFECGNNNKEGNEICDGTELNDKTCVTEGFSTGTLTCKTDCSGYDTSSCTAFVCGNNNKEGSEVCDGTALNSKTCVTQGFSTGTLTCKTNCSGYDTSSCQTFVCGNNNKEGNEVCDGIALNSKTCVTQGFDTGTLTCKTDCSGYDTSSCENNPEQHEVSITSSGYSPSTLTINVGDTVRWTNQVSNQNSPASDNHPTHAIYPGSSISKCGTAEESSIFDACDGLGQGETYSFTFNSAGNWEYHNHLNPGQTGTIIVQ